MALSEKTIIISIEKQVYGGYCLGRHNGKAILIPYGIPGEIVAASVIDDKKDYSFAVITDIIERSSSRIEPDCPHFTQCGGCSYLHVPYHDELSFKRTIIEDCLERIAGLKSDMRPGIEMIHDTRYHYRSHATIKSENGCPGFYRKGTNDLVSIRETGCFLLNDILNDWIRSVQSLPDDFRIAVNSDSRVTTSFQEDPVVTDRAGGLIYTRGINQFFQANGHLRERMLAIVKSYADMSSSEDYLDIDCGVGFFTLALAGSSRSGLGIDVSGENIHWANNNSRQNGIDNVLFQAMASSRIHSGQSHPDFIVADPPRSGIDKKTRSTIIAIDPSRIVYVSCNPSTFSRDARDFIAGGYALDALTLIDMFPCTHHVELVSRFIKQ